MLLRHRLDQVFLTRLKLQVSGRRFAHPNRHGRSASEEVGVLLVLWAHARRMFEACGALRLQHRAGIGLAAAAGGSEVISPRRGGWSQR